MKPAVIIQRFDAEICRGAELHARHIAEQVAKQCLHAKAAEERD